MVCPKCNKDACVLATTEQKRRVTERRGLFWRIVLFPWDCLVFLFRLLFGRKQTYYKKQQWHCNYCGYDFDPEKAEKQ